MVDRKALQVRLSPELLERFRVYAEARDVSMAGLLQRWIERAVDGLEPVTGSDDSDGNALALLAEAGDALVRAGRVLQQRAGVADLPATATTPHGGTSAGNASGTVSADMPRHSGFSAADPSDPFGTGAAPAPVRREPSQPVPAREWMNAPQEEPDLQAIKPLEASRKLYLEDDWALFRSAVSVEVVLADGSVLEAQSPGRTDALVALRNPVGGWPGGDGNKGLTDVCAPVSAVRFLETPEPKGGGRSVVAQLDGGG